jgi:Right handed beta helix region
MNGSFMEGIGVAIASDASFITVTNCEFSHIGRSGVQLNAYLANRSVTNIVVTACNIHDYVRWGIDLSCNSVGCRLYDIRIDQNRIHDIYQYAPGTWLGVAGTFPHFDGIILRLGGPPYTNQLLGTVGHPISICNNLFYNDSATATDAGTAMIFLTAFGGRVMIYNNVFINTLSSGFGGIYVQDGIELSSGSTQPDYWFCNNSFLDMRNMVTLRTLSSRFALTNGTVRIKNNIFCKTDTGANYSIETGYDSNSVPTEVDYNNYFTGRKDAVIASMYASGARRYFTLGQLQAVGYELHGFVGDPQYTDRKAGLGAFSSSNVLTLQKSSPCINAGIRLTNLFQQDMVGNVRRGNSWTLGAYNQPLLIINSPTNLKLLNVP